MQKRIYMDYAATTPVDKAVLKEMENYWSRSFGNPGSIHKEGYEAKKAVELSKQRIAKILGSKSEEIIFTSGGTESNNLVVQGLVKFLRKNSVPVPEMHFISSVIEHSSVLRNMQELENMGAKVTYIGVDEKGLVNPEDIKKAITEKTVLISICYANNEIGVIEPIQEITKIVKDYRIKSGRKDCFPFVHADACQAPLYLDLNVEKLGVDYMTLDAQKMYGPKGVGCLYKKKGVFLDPVIVGGKQENDLRSGTENVPLLVGFAKALELAVADKEKESSRLSGIRNHFINNLKTMFPKVVVNGSVDSRLPNNVNISYRGLDSEFAVLQLDSKGIACSTKSTCLKNDDFSYVVASLYADKELAKSTLRFTFGRETTKAHTDYLLSCLKKILK